MKFSVIIPTYRREEQLSGCLAALSRQNYSPDLFEVIVVDDGSNSPPESAIHAIPQLSARLLCQPHRGPASARNAGAAIAKGRFLAFTDDDCRPEVDWLHSIAARFEQDPVCAIGGKTINALQENPFSAASQLLIDYLFTYYNRRPDGPCLFTSNNLAVPASLFHSAGGFDESFPVAAAEDREFCDRLAHLGYRMIYAPEAVVSHRHELSLRRFWRQHYNYGTGAFRFHELRAFRTRKKIRVEPVSYYWNLLKYPIESGNRNALPLTALMALSQIANAAGFFHQKLAPKGDVENRDGGHGIHDHS